MAVCDQACETCYSDQPECLTCASDKLLHNGKCVSECPDGYFPGSHGRCRGERHICRDLKSLQALSTCCLLFLKCLPLGKEFSERRTASGDREFDFFIFFGSFLMDYFKLPFLLCEAYEDILRYMFEALREWELLLLCSWLLMLVHFCSH